MLAFSVSGRIREFVFGVQDGAMSTIGLLAGAAALVVAFVVIELRSKAPYLKILGSYPSAC